MAPTQLVFDAHVDSIQRALDLGHDLGVAGRGHLDLERGRAGGLGSVVFVSWVDPSYLPDGARARTQALLSSVHDLERAHPERLKLVGNGEELRRAHAEGRIAGIPGIEGGHSIEESLEVLCDFFEQGVRVMTLVWNNHLSWVRSCMPGAGAEVPAGLSEFGREVVREMNRLGMVVDVSHAGVQSFYDALDATSRPVIASHSGCHALHDHPRNLSDDQLRALAANGGVVGIVFHPGFLDAEGRAEEERVRRMPEYRALKGENDTDLFLLQGEFIARHAKPLSIERLGDHVLHAMEVAGPEHVGLGSDYDGIQRGPRGLEDASCYPNLARHLMERGLTDDEVRGVMGANMERVFERVTCDSLAAARETHA